MNPKRLRNGNLLVPRRAEGPGGLVGDALVEIGPEDPEFESWLAELERITPGARKAREDRERIQRKARTR